MNEKRIITKADCPIFYNHDSQIDGVHICSECCESIKNKDIAIKTTSMQRYHAKCVSVRLTTEIGSTK